MRPLIVSHRGAQGYWPENSLTGFRNTTSLPVDAVEFDVHLTRDGRIVVLHDKTVDRTTNASGRVADLDSANFGAIRLKEIPGESVPLLEDVLDVLAPTGFELHIEIKTGQDDVPYDGLEHKLLAVIATYGISARTLITSFSLPALQTVRALDQHIRVVNSIQAAPLAPNGSIETAVAAALTLPHSLVAIEKTTLAKALPRLSQAWGSHRIGCWTLKTAAEWSDWADQPVRHVITDCPPFTD